MDNGDYVDDYENLWFSKPLIRRDLSGEDFRKTFVGYATIAVKIQTDEIFVAGRNVESLEKGFCLKGLDLGLFQLEPGPMGSLE